MGWSLTYALKCHSYPTVGKLPFFYLVFPSLLGYSHLLPLNLYKFTLDINCCYYVNDNQPFVEDLIAFIVFRETMAYFSVTQQFGHGKCFFKEKP